MTPYKPTLTGLSLGVEPTTLVGPTSLAAHGGFASFPWTQTETNSSGHNNDDSAPMPTPGNITDHHHETILKSSISAPSGSIDHDGVIKLSTLDVGHDDVGVRKIPASAHDMSAIDHDGGPRFTPTFGSMEIPRYYSKSNKSIISPGLFNDGKRGILSNLSYGMHDDLLSKRQTHADQSPWSYGSLSLIPPSSVLSISMAFPYQDVDCGLPTSPLTLSLAVNPCLLYTSPSPRDS